MNEVQHSCSIANCPLPAEGHEDGEAGGWVVRLYYCREHKRERDKGTPMGGLGVDGTRVEFLPNESSEPQVNAGGAFPKISPH